MLNHVSETMPNACHCETLCLCWPSDDDWSWAHFYSQFHIPANDTTIPQCSGVSCSTRAHCLLPNVRIFCWPHKKIMYPWAQDKAIDGIMWPLLSKIILSTHGISMSRQSVRWMIALYRVWPSMKFENFAWRSRNAGEWGPATAKMFNRCSLSAERVWVSYGTTRSILYVNGTFITPVSTIPRIGQEHESENGWIFGCRSNIQRRTILVFYFQSPPRSCSGRFKSE